MTSEDLKQILEQCADQSLREKDASFSPRHFIACVSGALQRSEPALAAKLFSILERS